MCVALLRSFSAVRYNLRQLYLESYQESIIMSTNAVDIILPNLYLGDKNSAIDLELIGKLEVSHILSVDIVPLPQVVSSNFPNLALMQVCVADMPHEDLLTHFEASVKFVKEGVNKNGVLVHCYNGVSFVPKNTSTYSLIIRHVDTYGFFRHQLQAINVMNGIAVFIQIR